MCGIIGYIGNREATPILLDGLQKLEYRGYDSAGVAVVGKEGIKLEKVTGKVQCLVDRVKSVSNLTGKSGIGHTRWATHGVPNEINAHPHMSDKGRFAVVHNGIIENFAEIRQELEQAGIKFLSETDTEVIAQLLDYYYDGDVRNTLLRTLSRLEGSYALGVICSEDPETVYVAKEASPLIIGLGSGENYFASDITALIRYTKTVIDLNDGELAVITPEKVSVLNMQGRELEPQIRRITWDVSSAEKSGYEHFMLKEIMEQPAVLKATIEPRIKNGRISFEEFDFDIKKFDRILFTACGSAYHAGCVGMNIIEKLCRIPTEGEVASELRYADKVMDEKTLVIVISQSGETADTIAAMKECKARGASVLAIVNVVGSTIAKLADWVIYTWAGPEIAVATTKGYTTQVAVLDMFAVWAAEQLGRISDEEAIRLTNEIRNIPEMAQRALYLNSNIDKLAEKYAGVNSLFFIGRNLDYSICLEGSLKLKEISYIHSEAYAAGELKHGTIALIEPGRLVVALCCHEALLDKTISNMQQVKARGADLLAVALENNRKIYTEADNVIPVPAVDPLFVPIVEIIPLQLFAYYVAKKNGCDIDKPKNLAKSVTVE
ncbi:MAG: glutamine--fructose-6-phosphate transaminase (isomerizing) [Clostridiales bacterium]|nr:glutamine--fructose-6-phosphate transaminase (isomerizing) [Candidatus Crickella caballi]